MLQFRFQWHHALSPIVTQILYLSAIAPRWIISILIQVIFQINSPSIKLVQLYLRWDWVYLLWYHLRTKRKLKDFITINLCHFQLWFIRMFFFLSIIYFMEHLIFITISLHFLAFLEILILQFSIEFYCLCTYLPLVRNNTAAKCRYNISRRIIMLFRLKWPTTYVNIIVEWLSIFKGREKVK